ncbi:histidine phosphatase family protein [Patescibacteria group bacterium]|nr:histidine phosphatase family protein [Patescibacteria group bacterium]MBU1951733.1 histidine phosphatase family protein [Patescibacteria group bacterium]MBU2229391.1 histidine phosphatase family protein [Patescibacteria group bacterium]
MKTANYENQILSGESQVEKERNPQVPIIDIVRHGRTDYKELKDPNFNFDSKAEDFTLDTEHLDLNEDGIADAEGAARQLLATIDKDNEVVILVTSPNFRAHSTALVIEDVLVSNGVTLLNSGRTMETSQLRQINIANKEDLPEWIAADKKYREEDPMRFKGSPDKMHKAIAASLGKELKEVFTEDYGEINTRFEDYLRHMTNIYDYLNEKTKQQLAGKIIRIVTLTHEELPAKFMQATLGTEENLKNGQILELRPQDKIRKDTESEAEVVLYPKPEGESESSEVTVSRKFTLAS